MKIASFLRGLILTLAVSSLLSGCGGGGGGADAPGGPATIETLSLRALAVEGQGQNVVAVTETGQGVDYRANLAFFQQDGQSPDLLLTLNTVSLGIPTTDTSVSNITLTPAWAVATIGPYVAGVSLANAPAFSLNFLFQIGGVSKACATGNWLLVTDDTELVLFDISDPANPVALPPLTPQPLTRVTGLNASAGGFFVFTENGYMYIDLSSPTDIKVTAISDLDLGKAEKVYCYANKLYLAGPSKLAGKSKIARVDVSTPEVPVIEIINNNIPGEFFDFAFDGMQTCYILLDGMYISKYVFEQGNLNQAGIAPLTSYTSAASQLYSYKGIYYYSAPGFMGIFSY